MRQKIKDALLIAKTDRRIWFAAGFVLVVLFVFALTESPSYNRPGILPPKKASKQTLGPEEAFRDLIIAFKNDIEKANKERRQMSSVVTRYGTEFSEHNKTVTGIFETLADRFEQLTKEVDSLREEMNRQVEVGGGYQSPQAPAEVGIEKMGFSEEPTIPPPPKPQLIRTSVISPGDSVSVKLLTGVNAPVDGTPYPVVFRLNGAITGPDGSSLDLGESRMIAAAQGSEADSRALFRLTSLAMRYPDGRRAVIDIDGWIVGEDGIRGMSGRLNDKLGRLIAATAGVSFVAALGDSYTGAYNRSVIGSGSGINYEDVNIASNTALLTASERLGQILLDRYESLVPVVEILSGREVVAIFSKTSEVELLNNGDWDEGVLRASLD